MKSRWINKIGKMEKSAKCGMLQISHLSLNLSLSLRNEIWWKKHTPAPRRSDPVKGCADIELLKSNTSTSSRPGKGLFAGQCHHHNETSTAALLLSLVCPATGITSFS